MCVTWLLSLAAFLAISMSGRPSMLSPWLPSLRCLALYSTWSKEKQNGQHALGGRCLVLLARGAWWTGNVLTTHLPRWPVWQPAWPSWCLADRPLWCNAGFLLHLFCKRPSFGENTLAHLRNRLSFWKEPFWLKPNPTTKYLKPPDIEIRVTTHWAQPSVHQCGIPWCRWAPESEKRNSRYSASWPRPWRVSHLGAPAWWSSWICLSPWQTSSCNLSEKSQNYLGEEGKPGTELFYLKNCEKISRKNPWFPVLVSFWNWGVLPVF